MSTTLQFFKQQKPTKVFKQKNPAPALPVSPSRGQARAGLRVQ